MKTRSLAVLALALGMTAATGFYLKGHRMHVGAPGVKVVDGVLRDENGKPATTHCVSLPEIAGFNSTNLPIDTTELTGLPRDTTFGRKFYFGPNHFGVQVSVVLMGEDRTSIHQPQYCLTAQSWDIEKTEQIQLPINRPKLYSVPALKLSVSQILEDPKSHALIRRSGIYVYWFVSGEHITSDQRARMFSLARTMLKKGVLERWAYISYFATCNPGDEKATFAKLEQFIGASVPEFQIVPGDPVAEHLPVAKR